jgi:uncharacterized protein YbjT (DUF2867 family)
MTKILVTGATGNVGSQLVGELRARGVPVRAFVRDAARAKALLGTDVELAIGDFSDQASLRRAMQGVDQVFLTSADVPGKVEHEAAVVDAASAAWVQRVVKLSHPRPEIGSDIAFADWHGRIERHLRASGVPAVVLRGNFFLSGLLGFADEVRETGQLFAPAGDAKIAMIDPRDVAAAAAALLTGDAADGAELTVTGPEAITFRDVAEHLSAATGREVVFVDIPDEVADAALRESGAPDWFAGALVRTFAALRGGMAAGVTDTVRALTGRAPRSIAEWAGDHAAAFGV